jgi:hypothetical protein
MEIAIIGGGEVVIRFIDKAGRTLLQERITVSGSPKIQARRIVDLTLNTIEGRAMIAPVLTQQSNPKQRVTFDGENPSRFARRRCKEIGCDAATARSAENGKAPAPVSGRGPAAARDERGLDRLMQSVLRGKPRRR